MVLEEQYLRLTSGLHMYMYTCAPTHAYTATHSTLKEVGKSEAAGHPDIFV